MIKTVTFTFSRKINRKMAATINLVHDFELTILSCKAGGESELATRTAPLDLLSHLYQLETVLA